MACNPSFMPLDQLGQICCALRSFDPRVFEELLRARSFSWVFSKTELHEILEL